MGEKQITKLLKSQQKKMRPERISSPQAHHPPAPIYYHDGICKKCEVRRLLNSDDECADCIDCEAIDLDKVIKDVKNQKG